MPRLLLTAAALRNVLRQLTLTDVDELEVVHGTSRLYIRREPGSWSPAPAEVHDPRAAEIPRGIPVSAPLTGLVYTRPSPEQAPYAPVGALIEAGQVVALIETMKLFNEVISDTAGEVLEVVAQDGDLVEVGQPLLYLGPPTEGGPP